MNKRNCLFLIIILVFSISPFYCLYNIEVVEATHLTKTEYVPVLEVNGTIEAAENVTVSLAYPVYIKECKVKENDYVNKGQLLFVLDIEKMEEAVKSNSYTDYTGLNISFDRESIASISENIYASESGYVSQINAAAGSIVLSDEILCVINTDDALILNITLNQDDYSMVSVGDNVSFSPLIMPASEYHAQICSKTATVRKESSLTGSKTVIDVYAEIYDADDRIIDGLQFSGTVEKDEKKTIYTLPYQYINQDSYGEYVNIFSHGKVYRQYIETGIEKEDCVEILTCFDEKTVFLKNDYTGKGKVLLKYDS